jgi:predicted dinucleotide-binding enzyme
MMKIAVIGTGEVGSTLGQKLKALGHDVVFGSRSPGGDKATELTVRTGVPVMSHSDAVAHAECIINAVHGETSVETLEGTAIEGKILMDVGNYESAIEKPIDTPLAEVLQAQFPSANVVKTLNNISAHLMVDPAGLGQPHSVFIAGNDASAKAQVHGDLGDLSSARAMEELAPLWVRLFEKFKHTNFNLHLAVRD